MTAGLVAIGPEVQAQAQAPEARQSPQTQEQALRVDVDDARKASANALVAGRAQDALILAQGVLMGHPADLVALFVKARALREVGRPTKALQAARAAWRSAEKPQERYHAAVMMAQMHSAAGHRGRAQLWLRRAAEIAPDEVTRAAAVQDFRMVRRTTPWRFGMDLFLQPSDNLNNAPTEAQEVPGGLISVTPPLEGLRYGAGLNFRYSQMLGAHKRLHYGLYANGTRVRLTDSARQVPGAEEDDLSTALLGGSLTLEAISTGGDRLASGQVSLRRHWQGGVPLADVARLDLSVGQALTPTLNGTAKLGFERTQRHDSGTGNGDRRELGMGLTRRLDSGVLNFEVTAGKTSSQAYNVGRVDGTVVLAFALAEPVAGLLPKLSLQYGAYNYDAPWILLPNGPEREDRTRSVSLDLVLPKMGAYGFAPEIGLSFTDRSSNYTLYDSRGTNLRLGLTSVF
ncbi:surface lipoprotein assembly modifier [Sagittula salina]|uniref:DUF560 domain-containing protein n=1 Tax=Sagittula salina TaxID=2820268 RepID=A0A940MT97_9RHOB|nr:surface lipoprotein assembly modifier [Sagittula salina]MBP0483582.1 DUF560 domain-containing protein [Sagittula salina]